MVGAGAPTRVLQGLYPCGSVSLHEFIQEALRAEAAAIGRIADRVAEEDGAAWRSAVELITGCSGHLIVSGMGKSGLVGAKISATFSSLGQPSSVIHPAEAMHGDLGRVRREDVVLLLSYSGETEEVVNLAAILHADGVPVIGISRDADSALGRQATVHLSLGPIDEACPHNLAPTASTTAQLAIGDALALTVAHERDFSASDFRRSHPGGALGAALRRIEDAMRFRVGENVATVTGSITVREALVSARTAAPRRAGALLIIDDAGALAGVFTDGDLRRLVLDDPAALDRPLAEVMTADPKRLRPDDLVRDAVRLVREFRVDEIPVVDDDDRPLGLIDVQDLMALKVVAD